MIEVVIFESDRWMPGFWGHLLIEDIFDVMGAVGIM